MSDRELLELAAKAAGIDLHVEWDGFGSPTGRYRNGATGDTWNPLEDDGDALRLAVKLGIGLGIDMQNEIVSTYEPSPSPRYYEEDAHDANPYAATRRAIVRAAAEIARAAGENIGGRAIDAYADELRQRRAQGAARAAGE